MEVLVSPYCEAHLCGDPLSEALYPKPLDPINLNYCSRARRSPA